MREAVVSTERECGEPAVMRVFWPGREPLAMCAKHAGMALGVAAAMGMHLHTEPAAEGVCTNKVSQ
jgi:hypothetical protein